MTKKINPTLSLRTAVTLFVMLLTTFSAWATDITVTYKISVSGSTLSKPVATITNAATGTTVCTWDNGYKTLWPANVLHAFSDNYGITLKPDRDLDKTDKNENSRKVSTTAFKTEGNTTFTVNVRNTQYYLKSVTFKEDNKVKASLEVAPNSRSGEVTIEGEKFFNYITVELTTDRYYSLTPSGSISINTTPAITYNDTYYYTAGTKINVTPTNASCIVEGVSGVDNATIANDKRVFSFTMPAKDVSLSASLAEVHTISGVPNDVSISDPYTIINGTNYYLRDQAYTLTAPTNEVFSSFTAKGAASSTLTSSRNIATVTIGTADVTVNAELLVNAGTCGENATWRVSDENNDGTFETLHIEGTGDMANYAETVFYGTIAPWQLNFKKTITAVNIANGITSIGNACFSGLNNITEVTLPSSVSSIGGFAFQNCLLLTRINIQKTDGVVYLYKNAFLKCTALSTIVVPTPALAVEYKQNYLNNGDNHWRDYVNKLRVPLGNFLFQVDGTTAADAAYAITNGDDLRHLSSAVYATGDISVGKTFRQTADINLSSGGDFFPIGFAKAFNGTYDGKGHKIIGLRVNEKYGEYGLFGSVIGATVRNVVLVSPTVRATDGGNKSTDVAALIGVCSGTVKAPNTIENCHVINPTLTIDHPGSEKHLGVIVGYIWNKKTTVSNCYYYDNTNDYDVVGWNWNGGSVTRVGRARKVTLGDGVSVRQSASEPENGFVCDGDNYYRESLELTFNTPECYDFTYSVNGSAISGSTYTINSDDADANISVVMEPLNEISLKASKIDGLYWSTFYCGGAGYRIADGEEACAYTATVGEDVITLHLLGKVIPSGTAVIIVGEDGNISMVRDDVSVAENNVGNDLRGVDVATARTSLTSNDSETLYMLSNKNNNFGFHSFAAANVPARKAFFTVPSSANARAFSMVFEDDATVLGKLRIANDESSVYDLNGRKVSGKNLKPGVYVKGGKKVVIK